MAMSRSTRASIVDQVAHEFGRLDVLINMASLYQSVPFDSIDAGV